MTVETSEDSRFDNIRPYRDDEVPAAIERIMSNEDVVKQIINFQFKSAEKVRKHKDGCRIAELCGQIHGKHD